MLNKSKVYKLQFRKGVARVPTYMYLQVVIIIYRLVSEEHQAYPGLLGLSPHSKMFLSYVR